MQLFNRFVGITDWPLEAQHFTQIYGFIRITYSFVISLTQTFLILYILDALGFTDASIVITVMLTIRLATNYPTGILADHIGQRWVFGSAILIFSIGVFLLANSTMLLYFIISAAIIGFANAQASGALESWYDNNYQKFDISNDPEKKDYGYTMSRFDAAQKFVMGITFIIGGVLATLLGRSQVFIIEAILGGILGIFIINYMKDIQKENSPKISKKINEKNFAGTLKGGILFLFESKQNMTFVLGNALYSFSWTIWWNLILFPLYFGYTGADNLAGLLRSSLFFISVGIAIILSKFTKMIDKKRMNIINGLRIYILYGGVILLLNYVPINNQFSWSGIMGIAIIFLFAEFILGLFGNTLLQRVILDFFPSEYRNSLYSLVPSLVGVISILFLPLTGALIEKNGLSSGLLMCILFATIGIGMMEIAMRTMNLEKISIESKHQTLVISSAD